MARGLKIDGELTNQNRAITYHVKLAQGKTYQIDMIAQAGGKLDPYLRLIDPSGKEVAKDDDGGGGLNGLDARITFQVTEAGTHQIVATSILGGGRYLLTVQEKQ